MTRPSVVRAKSTRYSMWLGPVLIVFMALSTAVALLGLTLTSPGVVMGATLALWLAATFWAAFSVPGGYVFCAFLVSYFVFLLARPAIVMLFGPDPQALTGAYGTNFWSEPLLTEVFLLLYLGLMAMVVGAFIATSIKGRAPLRRKDSSELNWSRVQAVQTWAKICYFVTLPFAALVLIERSQMVSTGGFYDLRVESATSLPGIVHLLSGMNDVFFFAFLATWPSKRKAVPAILGYVLLVTLSLMTWQRSDFVLGVLFVVLYLIHRQHTDTTSERWISWRIAATGAVLLVPVVALLQSLGDIRGRSSAETSYPLFGLVDFLYNQGVTVNVVGYAIAMEDRVPEGRFYSFGPAIEFLKWNVGSIFSGDSYPTGQTAERVAEGHQLSHTISFLIMPDLYLQGSGYGSSFIAELWLDGGIIALFVGSVLLGIALVMMPRMLNVRSIVVTTALLMILNQIMFTPRANFIGFLVTPFGVPSLIGAATLVALTMLTMNKPVSGVSRTRRSLSNRQNALRVANR